MVLKLKAKEFWFKNLNLEINKKLSNKENLFLKKKVGIKEAAALVATKEIRENKLNNPPDYM